MRLLLAMFAGLLLLSVNLFAEENVDTTAPVRFDLEQFEAKWWQEIDKLSLPQKLQSLQSLNKNLSQSIQLYQIDVKLENISLINQLFKSLIEQYSASIESSAEFIPLKSYTIESWTALIAKNQSVEREINLANAEEIRFNNLESEHASAISKLLVNYRKQSKESMERKVQALEIIRFQLERLLFIERQRRLKHKLTELRKLSNQQHQALDHVVSLLEPDASQQAKRTEALQDTAIKIKKLNKALYRLELNRLSNSSSKGQFLTRLEELEYSAEVFNLQIHAFALQLEMYIEDAISDATEASQKPEESARQALRTERSKLAKQYEETFEALNLQSESERLKADESNWLRLQKVRNQLKVADLRNHEIEHLFAAILAVENQHKDWLERSYATLMSWAESSWYGVRSVTDFTLFEINESPVTLLDLFWAILVIVAAIFISNRIRRTFTRFAATKTYVSEAAVFTIGRIIHYVIIIAAVIIGFSTLGIDFSKLALVAGALSVGIGFGLQSIFNNFISGLILLFERPFKIGDLIELESGLRGRIKSINVRSTQISTWDNIDILVPNSEFISGRVTNYTFSDDLRRLHVPFGVAYGTDKELVAKAAIEAALRVPFTLNNKEQAPDIWLVNFGESSLDYELIVWIKTNKLPKRGNPKAAYLWEIETSLAQYNIEIPFPQRDLHVRTVDGKLLQKIPSFKNEGGEKS